MDSSIKIQKDIRDASEDLRRTFIDLNNWEKDIKEKEKKCLESEDNKEIIPPKRNSLESPNSKKDENKNENAELKKEFTKGINEPTGEEKTQAIDIARREANACKEKGNCHVKLNQYEQAIYSYTEAILKYEKDPVFYTNRALCYLKLEKYDECIKDCNRAIKIDPKTVKAFYRRMQAGESLGKNEEALKDCQKVLELDPKNSEARKSLIRISNRINNSKLKTSPQSKTNQAYLPQKPIFTSLDSEDIEMKSIEKPPHLQSKDALHRIVVKEKLSSGTNKDNKNLENSSKAFNNSAHISDEMIDKYFTLNNCGSYKEVKKENINTNVMTTNTTVTKVVANKPTLIPDKSKKFVKEENLERAKMNMVYPVPETTAMFHVAWKEMNEEEKYNYLKNINPLKINKLLGASFNSELLSEILYILSEFYIKDNLDVSRILREISKHNEINILSLFCSNKDKEALSKLLNYLNERKDAQEDSDFIKSKFDLNL